MSLWHVTQRHLQALKPSWTRLRASSNVPSLQIDVSRGKSGKDIREALREACDDIAPRSRLCIGGFHRLKVRYRGGCDRD